MEFWRRSYPAAISSVARKLATVLFRIQSKLKIKLTGWKIKAVETDLTETTKLWTTNRYKRDSQEYTDQVTNRNNEGELMTLSDTGVLS
jgi:hypothetical protein